jgi:hypothetical protein
LGGLLVFAVVALAMSLTSWIRRSFPYSSRHPRESGDPVTVAAGPDMRQQKHVLFNCTGQFHIVSFTGSPLSRG